LVFSNFHLYFKLNNIDAIIIITKDIIFTCTQQCNDDSLRFSAITSRVYFIIGQSTFLQRQDRIFFLLSKYDDIFITFVKSINIYKTCNQLISVPLKQIMTCWLEPVCQLLVKQSLNHHQSFLSAIQQTFQLHHQDPTVYYHLHFATKDNICSFIQLWVKKNNSWTIKIPTWHVNCGKKNCKNLKAFGNGKPILVHGNQKCAICQSPILST